jgi:hypothetical protein
MFPHGSLEQAERDAAEALVLYTRAGDRPGMALCLAAACGLQSYRGDAAAETASAARAVALAESTGDEIALTWAYWFSADAAPDVEVSRPRLAAALALANHTGAAWRVGRLLQRAGFIATESGSYPEAQILLAEALPPALRAEDHQCVADIHGTRAIACLYAGDTEGAARAAAQQLTWRGASESPGSPTGC